MFDNFANFARVFAAERLKQRRNLTPWLLLGAACFTPAIVFLVRLRHRADLPALYAQDTFWLDLWKLNWESIAILILPIVAILATSLILQVEDRNNTWKQVHASPQAWSTIYLAKLLMVLVAMAQFLTLAHAVLYASAFAPTLLFASVPAPATPFPLVLFAARAARYFVDVLPIVAAQIYLSLRFRNLMGPVGVGLGVWILALGMLNSPINYLIPYSYSSMDYLVDIGHKTYPDLPLAMPWLAVIGFAVFGGLGLADRFRHRGR